MSESTMPPCPKCGGDALVIDVRTLQLRCGQCPYEVAMPAEIARLEREVARLTSELETVREIAGQPAPQPPADVRERVARVICSGMSWPRPWTDHWDQIDDLAKKPYRAIAAKLDELGLLRTPRGEGEASGLAECIITCMNCGQDFDANDDAQARYHEAACEVVDHEPARVEIARRLRGAALRSEAQGEDGEVVLCWTCRAMNWSDRAGY